MPRKGPAPKRPLVNDPVYGSALVTQLINKVLLDGKKSVAERIVYGRNPEEGYGQHQAFSRGSLPPRWRCNLPGSG